MEPCSPVLILHSCLTANMVTKMVAVAAIQKFHAAGIVLGKLGADVTATDLPGNLPLLADNFDTNGVYYIRG